MYDVDKTSGLDWVLSIINLLQTHQMIQIDMCSRLDEWVGGFCIRGWVGGLRLVLDFVKLA